ncbi:MAG: cupredoxin domain-containing protein [Chloroflexota bacterium]
MKQPVSLSPLLFVAILCSSLFVPWAAAAPLQQVTMTLDEFTMMPATFDVQQGQPVTFTVKNAGKFPHNVTFELPSQGIKETLFTANLTTGQTQTATYTFPAAGTWTMLCPVDSHEAKGMKGSVNVLDAPASMPQSGGGGMATTTTTRCAVLLMAILGAGILTLQRRSGRQ